MDALDEYATARESGLAPVDIAIQAKRGAVRAKPGRLGPNIANGAVPLRTRRDSAASCDFC